MSDSWHKDEELDFLPKTALNPLINPLLERHLGRWAEVYFTSPPEKREQAVEELLQELEKEASGAGELPAPQPTAQVDRVTTEPEIVCPQCQHPNLAAQRFCGNCGSPLSGNLLPTSAEEPPQAPNHVIPEGPQVQAAANTEASELQWLRGKTFSQWEGIKAPVQKGKKLAGAGLGLIVLLAVFGSLYWTARDRPAPPSPSTVLVPPVVTQPESQPPNPSGASVPALQAPAEVHNRSHGHKVTVEAPFDTPDLANAGSGSQELLLAKQSLEGKTGVRDSATAARLLWKAVGKQNVQAALLLSDLYVRGDGVPRNCDQARLLLVAAARKGGTVAAQQLRSFESSGCR